MPSPAIPGERDRVVILGRRRAGKTIFLARLYEMGWNNPDPSGLRMMALDGNAHRNLMMVSDSLGRGKWPAATASSEPFVIEVSHLGQKTPLVAIDYAGEIFTNAFIREQQDEQSQILREHVDRAVGVILLLDPSIAIHGQVDERVDDDYGMVRAIRRIREWPGGGAIPITLVMTKCDEHLSLIKSEGGLRSFARKWYPNLVIAAGGRMKLYACAAVHARLDARGESIPDTRKDGQNLIEPLAYCLEGLARQKAKLEQQRQALVETQQRERSEASLREADRIAGSRARINMFAISIAAGLLAVGLIVVVIKILF
ncbi:GTPase domain-containing protein [Phycisphaerales bacterium]|nr:GTPase domain-containing protein [Phycisphaerales bacterium]